MVNYLILSGAIAAAALLIAVVGVSLNAAAQQGSDNSQSPAFVYKQDNKYYNYENGVFHVRAGGGGAISPLTWYFPRVAEIKVGETVTWTNPTQVGEPHTITFMMGNNTNADFAAPFVMSNANTSLTSAVPNANAEAVVMPGPNGTMIVVAANSRSISPTIIEANGNVTTMPPNSTYTMDGTEKFVNSGWVWPSGQSPPGFPPTNTFSVKFTKAGTYDYMCEVHPWMTGQVIVK
ncbi:MAG TPA: plastocyanin/azurin family copper-binding protein [Nitrososphaera sp.]|jgi:plastocyanin|nr:plastocyanin/azurin family copper-binding protein [Nitrososphaera sp.]